MGLFGRPTRTDEEITTVSMDPPEQLEEVPGLPTPLSTTVIASGVTLTGNLRGEGVVQVEGVVEGEIELKGAMIVAATGRVKGPVTADVVQVAGHIEGGVLARDHMRLEKTGSLEGDVTTVSLVVEDGGRLNGRSSMLKPGSENPEYEAPAKSAPKEEKN